MSELGQAEPTPRSEGPNEPSGHPVVAAFDLDGTLTNGGSVWGFLIQACGPWRTFCAALAVAPRMLAAAVLGGSAADNAKEALFRRTLAGTDAADLAPVAEQFGRSHLARHRRGDVGERFDLHRRLRHRIVVVSASPELYVGAVASALGADGVVATRLEVDGQGRLTGSYDGSNCRGQQKAARLEAWVQEHSPGASVWAYGNSRGDRRMLSDADYGVDVGRLGRLGRLRNFPRLGQSTPG